MPRVLHKFLLLLAAVGAAVPGPLMAGCLCADPAVVDCPQCQIALGQNALGQSVPGKIASGQNTPVQGATAKSSCCGTSCCPTIAAEGSTSEQRISCDGDNGSCNCSKTGPLPVVSSSEASPELVMTQSLYSPPIFAIDNAPVPSGIESYPSFHYQPPPERSLLCVWVL